MSSDRRVILERIADEAGVSVRTVQRVLAGALKETRPSSIRRATQIREIAARYRYLPNTAARAVRTGRFNTVALLSSFDPVRKVMFPGMLWALQAGLRRRDVQLVMGQIPDNEPTTRLELPKFLREWAVDGLMIYYNRRMPSGVSRAIMQFNLPAIWLNMKRSADCVFPDDKNAAVRATELLIERGHRDVALFSFSTGDHYSHLDREEGYREAMRRHAYPERVIRVGPNIPMGERLDAARAWLRETAGKRPTGLVMYEQRDAVPVFTACLAEGVRVPEDLSIVVLHDSMLDIVGRPIDTMVIPAEDLGRIGIEMLMKKIDAPEVELPPRPLPFHYREGVTVADRAP
mgnify:CR=1 FL=1